MHRRLLRCCLCCCCCCLVLLLLISVGAATKNEKCGETIKIKEPSYLVSPGYPVNYYPSQRCEWIIQAPEKYQRIVINFNPHFDLEDRECKYDFVELYDGENASGRFLGKFCGKIAPPPLVSPGPSLFIRFVSDYETHGAGFSIRYELFKTGPECSRNFTEPTGVIKSPGYPEKYPNALECTYTIFAQKMSEIIVEFEGFELELDSNSPASLTCRYDYLEIWDGFPGVGPQIGRYCGQNTPGRIRSSTGILTMIFHTDNAIAKEGFSANYTVSQSNAEEDKQIEMRAPSAASSTQSSRALYTQEGAVVIEEVESVSRPMLIVEVDNVEPQEATTSAQETRPDRVTIANVVADLRQYNREIERMQERLQEMQQTIKKAMDVLEHL